MVIRIDQLLAALDPVMADTGGIKCAEDIVRVVALMRDLNKLESRCIYLNLILATTNESFLKQFVNAGGWKIMNQWLADITEMTSDHNSEKFSPSSPSDCNLFIEDVLKALKVLPVSVEVLKQNATPRLVKNLSKDTTMSVNVQILAGQVVELWMDVIKVHNEAHAKAKASKSKKKSESSKGKTEEKPIVQQEQTPLKMGRIPKKNPSEKNKNRSRRHQKGFSCFASCGYKTRFC